ncbi:hypothetical protein DP107_17280 [Haloglomus irregulare]|uniref:Uncharacterized protein n=1 Tax=Haloglomus irregulare TaxID=2234134 RepID=A0A554MV03_9EURY|nr:hypothetical protein [Haloglomus irregulare]TSD08965.1 hypothetical protein DP107_17280 [Haloglomus irregulare]
MFFRDIGGGGQRGGGGVLSLLERLDDEPASDDGRPDDCDCGDWNADTELLCWPRYRDEVEALASVE